MFDFDIQRCTRKCFATERELRAGEHYYSVLVQQGADVIRRDYAESAWQGPPEGTIGVWKSQMPGAGNKKLHWAPNDVMLHYFEQLAEIEEKRDVRYVLALLMIRRRVVRQESTETDEQGREVAVLFSPKTEQEYRVVVELPAAQRVQEIQNELASLLYAGEPGASTAG
jgi:hypothetical protein